MTSVPKTNITVRQIETVFMPWSCLMDANVTRLGKDFHNFGHVGQEIRRRGHRLMN
jgi:hypothetical protein